MKMKYYLDKTLQSIKPGHLKIHSQKFYQKENEILKKYMELLAYIQENLYISVLKNILITNHILNF